MPMAALTDPTAAETRAGAEWLLSEFAWRVDNGEGTRVVELFTEDATVHTSHFELAGRAQIDDWFTSRARGDRLSRHFWSNLRIEAGQDGEVVVRANAMTLMGAQPAPHQGAKLVAGTSTDTIVRSGDGWRFSSRRLDLVFEGEIVASAPGR
jgi:hypothetical protein